MISESELKGFIYPKRITAHDADIVAYFRDNETQPWFLFTDLVDMAYNYAYVENIRDHWLTVSKDNRAMATLHDGETLYFVNIKGVVEFLHKKVDHECAKKFVRSLKKQVNKLLRTMPKPLDDTVGNGIVPNAIGSFLIRSLPVRYVRFSEQNWFRGADLCQLYCAGSIKTFMLTYESIADTEKRMVSVDGEDTCLLISEAGVEQFLQWLFPEDYKEQITEFKQAFEAEEPSVTKSEDESETERHGIGLYFTKAPYVIGDIIDWVEIKFEKLNDKEQVPVFTAFIDTKDGVQCFFKPSDICKVLGTKPKLVGIPWEQKACFSLKEEDRRRAVLLSAEGIKTMLKKTELKNRAVHYSQIFLKVAKQYEECFTDWFNYRKRKYEAYKYMYQEDNLMTVREKMITLFKSGDTIDYVTGAIMLAEELRFHLTSYKSSRRDIVTGKGLPGPRTKTLIEDLWKFIDTQDPKQEIGYLFKRAVEKAWSRYQTITA